MSISFHNNFPACKISEKIRIKNWIKRIILDYGKNPGNLNIIIVDDQYLIKINSDYLNHNYYTDIITFNYNREDTISGDLFISYERVRENALKYKAEFKTELLRVIIHGILHLLGYNDKSADEKGKFTAWKMNFCCYSEYLNKTINYLYSF